MKKIFFILACLSLLVISLSVAYCSVIFLPQKERANEIRIRKIEQHISNIRRNIENAQATPDTSNIQDQLDDINNSIQEQKRDRQMQADCESNGGRYQGSGLCVYY